MDPAKMKVVDLRSELGALGLDTKGNKPALVERLKKALESKSGKAIADTTILDTSTEDAEDTPKRPGPAARTRRRSSSLRPAGTPAKQPRRESPEPIPEVKDEDRYSPGASSPEPEKSQTPEPVMQKTPEKSKSPSPVKEPSPEPSPQPSSEDSPEPPVEEPAEKSPAKAPVEKSPAKASVEQSPTKSSVEISPSKKTPKKQEDIADNEAEKPAESATVKEAADESPEAMDTSEAPTQSKDSEEIKKPENEGQDADNAGGDKKRERKSRFADREPVRELTEEEEWDLFNERLLEKEKERIEREKKQAEDDAKKLEEFANDPVKFKRLQRKYEKKQRWNNYYRNIEVTNEILAPPAEEDFAAKVPKPGGKGKKDGVQADKYEEPELDDSKITLSWYDSDLNQYLHLPDLNEVTAMNDGTFAHAWAGVRASHGVTTGRVCFEVKIGATVTTEIGEKEPLTSSLRIGWSTADQPLHLGEGERSWAFESNGRAVHNSEFKEFGKELAEKDIVGAYVDLESNPCKISYTLNGVELGVAYEFDKNVLEGKPLFPHILTKSMCYRINFGYDRYNMLTKTKIVRNRLEIPVKQVLEEKRKREQELQRAKDEVEKKEKERKEKEKLEREERQKKKREEREKQDRERKEKEAAERRERGEVDKDAQANGDKPPEPVEVKQEPQEDVEMAAAPPPPPPEPAVPAEPAPEVKEEPAEAAESAEAPAEVTEDQVLGGHVLDKRIKFVIRYTADEELDGAEACLLPGYILIAQGSLVQGPTRPASMAECEVILMVGMPGSGKSHWVKQRVAAFPDKRYNVLSTGSLFDKMKVDCKPFKATYEGRWDAMISKTAKCVLKLVELAHGRLRNFILDQTNVYPSAQRRKLREFDGYRRIAVAVVTDEETYKQRCQQRESADGKEVPDAAILDMKANFSLPEKSPWVDEVIFPYLNEEEAKKVVDAFHKEAKAAGVMREKEKRERSAGRDAPVSKRQRSQDKRHGREDRGRSRDSRENREDRWGGGGGGGGNRWGNGPRGGGGGGGGGGGNRWGRDRSGSNNRFGGGGGGGDRPWGNNQRGGDYNNRDRDNFRGGSGGRPPMLGGGGPPRGPPGPPIGDRFNRERNNRPPPQIGERDKRGPPGPQGPPPPNAGGGGSWQRGGQIQNNRGGPGGNRGGGNNRNPKDGNQNQQNPGWNQWAGGWGGWGGNWNQNQQQQQQQAAAGWNNWQNWQNWQNQAAQAGGQPGQQPGQAGQAAPVAANASGNSGKNAPPGPQQQQQQQQQWPANYTAQQWYQWQQWQQQQQNWAGYQQQQQPGQGNQAATNTQEAQAAWAQYYQNYGNAAAAAAAAQGGDKKS